MLEMSRRLENLMNDAKMEIKTETISVTRRKIGGISFLPHLFLLKIGMWRQISHLSTFLLEGLKQLNSGMCDALDVAADQADATAPKLCLYGNLTTQLALFRATYFFKKEELNVLYFLRP